MEEELERLRNVEDCSVADSLASSGRQRRFRKRESVFDRYSHTDLVTFCSVSLLYLQKKHLKKESEPFAAGIEEARVEKETRGCPKSSKGEKELLSMERWLKKCPGFTDMLMQRCDWCIVIWQTTVNQGR